MKFFMKSIFALTLTAMFTLTACSNTEKGSEDKGTEQTKQDQNDQTNGDTLEFTFADYGNSTMPPAKAYAHAIQYVSDTTGGRIKIDYVGDAQLGNESEMIQQLMDGTLQCAALGTSTFSKYMDKLEAFQMPFLLSDYDKEYKAFMSEEGKALLDEAETIGLKIIGFAENGMRHFANNQKPIQTPEDLNGLILRIAPSTLLQESMELLGANPTPLNYGEVYTALQNKVIDGEEINITSLYAMKHYETIKYVSEIGMYPFPMVITVNLDWWNGLSEIDRVVIEDGFQKGADALFESFLPGFETEARAACEKSGVVFNVIEDNKAFREKVQPVYDSYLKKDEKIKTFIEYAQNLN